MSESTVTKRSLENQGNTEALTLKEKFAIARAQQKEFTVTPEIANAVGMLLYWWAMVSYPPLMMFYILRHADPHATWAQYGANVALSLFLTGEMLVQWLACNRNSHEDVVTCPVCKIKGLERPVPPPPLNIPAEDLCNRWHYCALCASDSPPRAHHCKVCKVCILKRDHHCYFTGRCVGFNTQKHFVPLTMYTFASAIWVSYWLIVFLGQESAALNLALADFFLPWAVVRWVLRYASIGFVFSLLQLYLSVLVGGLALFYLVWETSMVLRGQTSYEASVMISRYRRPWRENLRSVFGSWGIVCFLWPMKTRQSDDGYHWRLANRKST